MRCELRRRIANCDERLRAIAFSISNKNDLNRCHLRPIRGGARTGTIHKHWSLVMRKIHTLLNGSLARSTLGVLALRLATGFAVASCALDEGGPTLLTT